MKLLETIFSDPTYAGIAGMVLFAGVFIIIGLLAINSKPKVSKK